MTLIIANSTQPRRLTRDPLSLFPLQATGAAVGDGDGDGCAAGPGPGPGRWAVARGAARRAFRSSVPWRRGGRPAGPWGVTAPRAGGPVEGTTRAGSGVRSVAGGWPGSSISRTATVTTRAYQITRPANPADSSRNPIGCRRTAAPRFRSVPPVTWRATASATPGPGSRGP